ncbi:MAG TPA: hypothetical protein VLG28_13860 [Acidimicrobiia bacterium]|nr:hypothetical protein [Acidimicrobiia bacterium]
MDELIKQLQEKTGLGVDQIKQVIDGVMDFMKDKLPAPLANRVAGFLDGDSGDGGGDDGGNLLDKGKDMLGGLMGGGN